MKKSIKNLFALVCVAFGAVSCFNLDEETFDRIGANEYYKDEISIQGAVSAIYYSAANRFMEYGFYLQELSADQIAWRAWNGGAWGWDEAEKFVLSAHSWTPEVKIIRQAWESSWETIGLCNNLLTDLKNVSASDLGISEEAYASYVAEVRSLRAWQYYNIFELWGGTLPIFEEGTTEVPGSADTDFATGCKKVYEFIMNDLDESVNALKKNAVNSMNQAANRILKARLLLNAEIFIGENHFAECAELCQQIINGEFGNYSIVKDYRDIYGYNNASCPEVVFAFAQEPSHFTVNCLNIRTLPFLPYNYKEFLGYKASLGNDITGWNCTCIAPSYDNSGEVQTLGGSTGATCFLDAPYNDQLGAVYERFDNRDIRKANYKWEGDNYSGIFLIGAMKNITTGKAVKADADRDGQDLVYVDQVGTFQNKGKKLETIMSPRWGETNSGYRLMRYPMAPESTGLKWEDIDEVEIRLTEAYFMLAECKMRMGDLEGGKQIVDDVRYRYFSGADWNEAQNDPGRGFSEFNLDWMLNQWGQEYLGEGRRRRTDLRRFDKFTQGQWWFFGRATEDGYNLPAKRDRKYEWYPLPQSAISVNAGLVQNPAYVSVPAE